MRACSLAAGPDDAAIRNILSGKSIHPRQDTLEKIAGLMGCGVDELLGVDTAARKHRLGDGSMSGESAAASGPNEDLLAQVIEGVEAESLLLEFSLTPRQKARAIVLFYKYFADKMGREREEAFRDVVKTVAS